MNREQRSRAADGRLRGVLSGAFDLFGRAVDRHEASLREEDFGRVDSVSRGVVRIKGLPGIRSEELIRFPGPRFGLAFNLDPGEVAAVLLDAYAGIQAGAEVYRTGRVADVPVGEALLGRVIDPLGRPLDRRPPPRTRDRLPAERPAPALMARAPVEVPLQTGLLAVDALIPIGRGQRELILGDRQTGKTAIALDTIINQRDKDVVCVYCSIGREASEAAKVVADLRRLGAMDYSIVVVATGEDPPGVSFLAPYAATSMAEFFTERGQDTLVVYDDLTRHARSYRELSLLLRRPPAREAYPGDIFYIHSRLLERASHMRSEKGGGSLTALPIIETQAENLSAYIPTNLISITDGQIYLSPKLFGQGILPAIDVGQSVSRVGGKTQLPGYRAVSGSLRLSYSQFKELETFARFGTRLDEETRRTLERGRRVQEVLKQPRYSPVPADEQLAVFLAVTSGVFDEVPLDGIAGAKEAVRRKFREEFKPLAEKIRAGEKLSDEDREAVARAARKAVGS